MARIGTSAAISAGTRGHSLGAARRRAPMRAAVPIWLFSWLPRYPMLAAR
jgi:hypothetical protein